MSRKKRHHKSHQARHTVLPRPKIRTRPRSVILCERVILLGFAVVVVTAFVVFGLRNVGKHFLIVADNPPSVIKAMEESNGIEYITIRGDGILGYAKPTWRWDKGKRITEIYAIAQGYKVLIEW